MSLWKNMEDLKAFAKSGAHLDAMRRQKEVAKEIRTYTFHGDQLPDWKTAKAMLLEKGKAPAFN